MSDKTKAIEAIQQIVEYAINEISLLAYNDKVEYSGQDLKLQLDEITAIIEPFSKEKVQDTIYDWGSDLVTKEVRWLARDSSGAVYGYIDECPTLSSEEWDPEGFYNYNIGQTVIKKEVPWRESLEKRPE